MIDTMVNLDASKSILGEAAEKLGFHAREAKDGEDKDKKEEKRDGVVVDREGEMKEESKGVLLSNRAGESRSPYVRAHKDNPVAWQLWGDEAIDLAKKENKLLFVSIGYSACHWCHVMERESFENDEVASILNKEFIPVKIDREERPDIDRIYMNFVQATTGSGGWPLNVFVTPTLEPVFGGTYWPGPNSSTPQLPLEEQVDFLGILKKLSSVWKEQEQRCRQDSSQILLQLKEFSAEGTVGGGRLGEGADGLDIELLEEAYQHLASTFDTTNSGFGSAPKFPTPTKLAFLLRLPQFPEPVIDIVGAEECAKGEFMALATLRAMARGGIRDHIGHGFARYSVTADWSLPHFEKMLYDNVQLLHVYLDAFLSTGDPELLGVVYDITAYLTSPPIAAANGGFYSSEDADSFYRRGDTEKREGAYYVWTQREFDTILGSPASEIISKFYGVEDDGNVSPEHDVHDEFIAQNVLRITSKPAAIAAQFGMSEREVVRIIKESKAKLLAHRKAERVPPNLDDKIVAGWNGIAIGALARTGSCLEGVDNDMSSKCIGAAEKAANFIRKEMYDPETKVLKRVWREVVGSTNAFADDYAFLVEGLIDLYDATWNDDWLKWADELQATQIRIFADPSPTSSGFFSTAASAPHTILRLKDGMDSSEPSTNGTSASNLFRLAALLNDDSYEKLAKTTLEAFEAEMLQYPWLFGSFMPGVVAARLGVSSTIIVGPETVKENLEGGLRNDSSANLTETMIRTKRKPRGGLDTTARLGGEKGSWLRERNALLTDLKAGDDGRERRFVCEGHVCREVGEETERGADKAFEMLAIGE